MVRFLLSKGSDPVHADRPDLEDAKNVSMRYWLQQSKQHPNYPGDDQQRNGDGESIFKGPCDRLRPFGLQKTPELWFMMLGQRLASFVLTQGVNAHFVNPVKKPYVMMMPGPPGHGKTYSSSRVAATIADEDDILVLQMGEIKDDADLWGSNLGGGYSCGSGASNGQITQFLRERQLPAGRRKVVILDEFEKIRGLTSALGHGQVRRRCCSVAPLVAGGLLKEGAQH